MDLRYIFKKQYLMFSMKNKGVWIIVAIIVGIAIVIGAVVISNSDNSKTTNECSKGYFWTGNNCCYDSDSNGICDSEQKLFEYVLNCDGITNMKPCVDMCISKCGEVGFRIAVSAVDGEALASHPYFNNQFYCNCVPN